MHKVLILFSFLLSAHILSAQIVSEDYKKRAHYADSLYQLHDYKNAAIAYSSAFKLNRNKGLVEDRYNAACSYALSGNIDSAFYNLFRIVEKAGWNKYERLLHDTNLLTLHNDVRWNKLVNKVR